MITKQQPESPIAQFGDFISEHKAEIIDRWIRALQQGCEIPTSSELTYRQVTDHLPQLFEDLCRQLHQPDSAAAQAANDADTSHDSRTHGSHRWQQGYRLDELVRETGIMRRLIVVDYLNRFIAETPTLKDDERDTAEVIIHKFFDELTSQSVQQYVEERDREVRVYGEQLTEANRSLQEINAQLRQVDESRLRLTRTISHELRNFLNGVNMAAQLLQRTDDESIRQKVLANLNRHVGDMKELLNQLLDYSVLLAGRTQLRLESFDLPSLFDDLVTSFKPQAEAAGLAFTAELDRDLQTIVSDRLLIKQITSNLITNAIKYTKEGRIALSMRAVGREWEIVVEDTGMGIRAEDLKRVFAEFERVGFTAEIRGTGLGLAITQSLAELLQGRVEVQSEVGKGSRFQVTLPLDDVEARP